MARRFFHGWFAPTLASVLSLWIVSTAAFGSAMKLDTSPDLDAWCNANDCLQLFQEIVDNEVASRLRLFEGHKIERFNSQTPPLTCRMNRPLQPAYFALLIAPGYEGGRLPALKGPANDVVYLSEVLKERGVAPEHIMLVKGPSVNRDQIIGAMRDMLACLHDGDQLFLAFSGHGTQVLLLGERSIENGITEACTKIAVLAETGICEKDVHRTKSWKQLDQLYQAENSLLDSTSYSLVLLANMPKDETFDDWTSGRHTVQGLLSIEIANFVNQVRNLNADVFVLIDTAHAASARLSLQSKPQLWFSNAKTGSDSIKIDDYAVKLTGRGQMGVFYAVGPQQLAFERAMSRLGEVGVFSYLFSEALRKLSSPSMAELAAEIYRQYAALTQDNTPLPVIQASSPALAFMPATAAIEPNERDIEIIQPVLKRGVQILEADAAPVLPLVARYVGKGKAHRAIIDGEVVDIDLNGQFRKTIDTSSGKTNVDIRVLSRDFATLSHRVLNLKLSDRDIILSSSGRKLALFIANQDYEDERFNDLQTPKADAEAVRRLLTEDYGFSTSIDREDGGKLDLFLVNATRGAVSRVLFELRKRLTREDELIIYYAGHGDTVEGAGSYWVPVDGKHDEYFDWIDANDITTELKLMNAKAILLISDSCYSGGLARGDTVSPPSSEARDRYLAKARSFKSRQLIASGGEEPVEDGGGGGHSVFAKALIDGLTTMPGDAFTASELLEQKVKPEVISLPTALADRQIPGFHRIAKAGDEIGSEFIFVRKGAARQAASP